MTFIQIVSFRCSDPDALRGIEEEWLTSTEGRRRLRREVVLADREDPTRFVTINEFDSYEDAMANSELPETDAMAKRVAGLLIGQPTYMNLDVLQVTEFEAPAR